MDNGTVERRVLRSSDWRNAQDRSGAHERPQRVTQTDLRREELSTVRELLSGEYAVQRHLADGRVSLSFEAEREGRRGTVLVLPVDCEEAPERAAVFERNARELRAIDHPGVVGLRDFGIRHGVPFLEYEALRGRTLAEQLLLGPVARDRALRVALDILSTLAVLHVDGHTHGALRPADVDLVRNGYEQVRLLGVGVARLVRQAGGSPRDGAQAESYLAPEVTRDGRWDARADVYSVGALLYHMLADEVPPPPPAISAFAGNPLLPPDLEPVLIKALAMDPADRFGSAEEMSAEIADALGARRAVSTMRPPAQQRVKTDPGARTLGGADRRRMIAVLGALAVAAAVVGVVVGTTHVDGGLGAVGVVEPEAAVEAAAPDGQVEAAATDGLPAAPAASPVAASAPTELRPAEPEDTRLRRGERPADIATGLPFDVEPVWARIAGGERVTREELSPIYAWSRRSPSDARPHLMLAEAFMSLGWYTDTVERYRNAHGIDPSSRHHPEMLENLMLLTMNAWVSEDAVVTVEEIYGVEALAAVEAAIASEPGVRPKARLEQMRRRLQRRGRHQG